MRILFLIPIFFVCCFSCIDISHQRRNNKVSPNNPQWIKDGITGHRIYSDTLELTQTQHRELTSFIKLIDEKWIINTITIDSLSLYQQYRTTMGHHYFRKSDSLYVYRCISVTVCDTLKKNYMRYSFPYCSNTVLIQDGYRHVSPEIFSNTCTGNYTQLRSYLFLLHK